MVLCSSRKPASIFAQLRKRSVSRIAFDAFRRDARASTVTWFALSLPIVLMFVGAAVDYNNESTYRTQLQAAVDSAAIAAAVAQAAGKDPVATAQEYVANNFNPPPGQTISSSATMNMRAMTVSVTASGSVPTYLMKLFGYASLPIDAIASAIVGSNTATEVSIVFDTTYSMSALDTNGLTKLENAKADAVQLVQAIMTNQSGQPNPNVRVGLVPFGVYVNIKNAAEQSLEAAGKTQTQAWAELTTSTTSHSNQGTYNVGAYNPLPWLTNTNTNKTYASVTTENYTPSTCVPDYWVTETCYNDTIPYDCSHEQYTCTRGHYISTTTSLESFNYSWSGCVSTIPNGGDLTDTISSSNPVWGIENYACASSLQRLTNNKTSLINQINALTAYDDTYIGEGLIWGWRVLSPNSPFSDGGPYHSTTRKILILMTDGVNTNEPNPTLLYPQGAASPKFGPGYYANNSSNSVDGQGDANTRQVCANIQNAGIIVYTVAFEVTNPTIKSILQRCATSPSAFFDAGNINDLQTAFQAIGNSISAVHLTQ